MQPAPTDSQLLARYARTRDAAAIDTLIRRYVDFVYATALRETSGDAAAADDVTQAVFLTLMRKADSIPHRHLGGWLFRVVRYAASNARRLDARRARNERRAASARSEVVMPEPSSATVGDQDEVLRLLNDALASLSSADREAVILRYLQSAEYCVVAQALSTTEAAARKRVTRAVQKLRSLVASRGVASVTTPSIVAALTTASVDTAPAATVAAVSAAAASTTVASVKATAIATGVMKMMLWSKIKLTVVLLVAASLTAVAAVEVARHALGAPPAGAPVPPAAGPAAAPGQEPEVIERTISPARPPVPSLRYRLLPAAHELRPGDAAVVYGEAAELFGDAGRDRLNQVDNADLQRAETAAFLQQHRAVLAKLHDAAMLDRADWPVVDRGQARASLPYLNTAWDLSRLLELEARLAIAEQRHGDALRSVRAGIALAQHLAPHGPIVQGDGDVNDTSIPARRRGPRGRTRWAEPLLGVVVAATPTGRPPKIVPEGTGMDAANGSGAGDAALRGHQRHVAGTPDPAPPGVRGRTGCRRPCAGPRGGRGCRPPAPDGTAMARGPWYDGCGTRGTTARADRRDFRD